MIARSSLRRLTSPSCASRISGLVLLPERLISWMIARDVTTSAPQSLRQTPHVRIVDIVLARETFFFMPLESFPILLPANSCIPRSPKISSLLLP